MSEEHEHDADAEPDTGGAELVQQEREGEADAPEPAPAEGADDADAEEADAEEPEGSDEDDSEPQATAAPPVDAKALEKMGKRLDTLRAHVKSRVADILGDGADDLIQCPTCTTVAPGWLFPPTLEPLDEEQESGMRALLGIAAERDLKHDPATQTCETCDGEGAVMTGSKREGYKTRECKTCASTGYVTTGETVVGGNGHWLELAPPPPPEHVADVAGDPAVIALRDRGFTVIPPPQAVS